jgi:hypothetical protein
MRSFLMARALPLQFMLVDSFAPAQSPLPRGFAVYPTASQLVVFSPAVAELLSR